MDTNGARRGISRALLLAFTALFVVVASGCSSGSPTPRVSATPAPSATSTRLPLAFEPNVGQAPADVRYVARSERYRIRLTPTGARFAAADSPGREIRLSLIGGAAAPSLAPVGELPGKAHYFIGKSEADWRTNVATYRRVVYRSVYPGTDLVFHGDQREAEFDFVVAPGADPGTIALSLEGAEQIGLDGDDVVARAGEAELRLHRPVVYQESAGRRLPIDGRFVLTGRRISFEVGAYDRARPLVIDPVVTFLGDAASGGGGGSIGRDAAGNLYVTRRSQGVTKLSPDGSTALYTVTLGTSQSIYLAVDPAGHAYVLGRWGYPRPSGYGLEDPAYYPTTPNALAGPGRPHFQGDFTAVVAKLSPDGSQLLYSSFVGGDSGVDVSGIAVDPAGNFYYTGWGPYPGGYPQTRAPFTGPGGANGMPAWIQAVAADYSRFLYAALIYDGSTGFRPSGIAVDGTGHAYLTGMAGYTFPTTPGAYQRSAANPGAALIAKIAPDGSQFDYATFLGNQYTVSKAIAVDADGNAYVAGSAVAGLPTQNAIQAANAGGTDAFVARLDPTGSLLIFSTYLGGSADDSATMIGLDGSANVYVAGRASSTNFPQQNPLPADAGAPGGSFAAELTSDGRSLVYSTYLGTTQQYLDAMTVTPTGTAYITGGVFIAKLEPSEVRVFITSPADGATVSGSVWSDMWAENYVGDANTYTLSIGGTVLATSTANNHATMAWDSRSVPDGPQTLTATVRDSGGHVGTATRNVTIRNGTPATLTAAFTSPVDGVTVTGNVTIAMSESGANGTPITFTLSVDSTQIFTAAGTATSASYSWNSASVANGSHTLDLTVRDGAGRTATAARSVTVTNMEPPPPPPGTLKVFITSPADGATVNGTVWSDIWVEGAAAGTNTFTLSIGGTTLGSGTGGNHVTLPWDSTRVINGTQTLTAAVRDASSNSGAATRAFNVQNAGGGTPPPLVASFTSPADGATVSGTVGVGMSETGASGTPISFTLRIDGTQVSTTSGTATTATYSWNTTTVSEGSHTLSLTVGDGAGRTSTATRTVTVANGTPPPPPSGTIAVFITAPGDGATVNGTAWFTIWIENAAAGSKTYTLSVGGTTMATTATTSNGPVSIPWSTTGTPNGSRTVTVTVRDSAGATGSATRMVNVAN